MRSIDLLALSTRMFRNRMLRTALTILGVSVGIGTIVFLVSLGFGLQAILLENITTSESLLSLDVTPPDTQVIRIDDAVIKQFQSVNYVQEVVPVAALPVQITYKESTTDVAANVTNTAYFRLSGINADAGTLYPVGDSTHVVISSAVAEIFDFTPEEAIGRRVSLSVFYSPNNEESSVNTAAAFTKERDDIIVGGVIQGDSTFIYFPPAVFSGIQVESYAQVKVRVENADVLETVRNEILNTGFSVTALSDVVEQANKIFNALQWMLAVFGTAALVVSAIGMFNTMTIAFLERTQEIGIMRSLGASKTDMFLLFFIESGLMGFLGGIGGITIGYTLQFLVNFGIDVLAKNYGGSPVDLFRTPIWFVLTIVIFSTIVGLATGIAPGRRASSLNPLRALKYR